MGLRHRKLVVLVVHSGFLYSAVIILGLIAGLWLLKQPAVWTNLPLSSMVSGKKVVIDAGHGGDDPGAKSAAGLREKEINLDVALQLKKYLSRVGVYCVMTRETDRDFFNVPDGSSFKKRRDLLYRARIANESGADLFISIHGNSFPESIYHGAQVFYDRDDPRSRRLAQAIQNHLVKELGPNHRRPKPGNFRVLTETKMPGVTIEVGFLSNPEEARLLGEPHYRDRIAEAISHGVIAYFSNQIPPPRQESEQR